MKLYSIDKLDNRLTILAIELAKLLYGKASITILSSMPHDRLDHIACSAVVQTILVT